MDSERDTGNNDSLLFGRRQHHHDDDDKGEYGLVMTTIQHPTSKEEEEDINVDDVVPNNKARNSSNTARRSFDWEEDVSDYYNNDTPICSGPQPAGHSRLDKDGEEDDEHWKPSAVVEAPPTTIPDDATTTTPTTKPPSHNTTSPFVSSRCDYYCYSPPQVQRLLFTPLFPDQPSKVGIGGMPLLDGVAAVRLVKFLTVTWMGIFIMYFLVRWMVCP